MDRILVVAALIALAFAPSCRTPIETTFVPMDSSGWKIGIASDFGRERGTTTVLIPSEETIESWSERLTIQLVATELGQDARKVAEDLFASQRVQYGDAVVQRVLAQDEWSVLFEWLLSGDEERPDQHKIARFIEGHQGLHRATYTLKSGLLSDESRERWVERLGSAVVLRGDKAIR